MTTKSAGVMALLLLVAVAAAAEAQTMKLGEVINESRDWADWVVVPAPPR